MQLEAGQRGATVSESVFRNRTQGIVKLFISIQALFNGAVAVQPFETEVDLSCMV